MANQVARLDLTFTIWSRSVDEKYNVPPFRLRRMMNSLESRPVETLYISSISDIGTISVHLHEKLGKMFCGFSCRTFREITE